MRYFSFNSLRPLLVLCLGLAINNATAQSNSTIKGQVIDTAEKVQLLNASVNLLRAKDSVLLNAIRADKEGRFEFTNVKAGKYVLMVSYPQYADYVDKIEVDKDIDLNKIYLNTKAHLLKEVIVRSTVSAIRIKGDTTEYKADSFRVTPNADVQELLKKMPGIQVNAKGEITAQGEKVNKVLVDGEEFFSDDPAVVTKNLRADAIDKVQVFDKKSDQATFTGIDDGEKSKTINLQLKDDKKNGFFGKAEIGTNFGEFGNGKLMANAFKGKKKLAAYVTTDNTKFEALNWDESRNYGDGGNTTTEIGEDGGMSVYFSGDGEYDESSGLPNQKTAGAVFSNKWNKVSTNNTGQYQNLLTNSLGTNYTKTLLQDSSITNYTNSKQRIDKKKYKFNTINEWGTDTTGLFKVIVKVANVLKDATNDYNGATYSESGRLLNNSNRITSLNEDDKTLTSNLSYRKKFAKKGRSIAVNSDLSFNDKAQDGYLNADNSYFDYTGTELRNDIVDQFKQNQQNTAAVNTNITYTEPLSTKSFLVFKYGLKLGKNDAERNSYNKNASGKYEDRVDSLSNHFVFNTLNNSGSVNYRFVEKKYNFVLGTGFGTANYQLDDIQKNTQRAIAYNNFIPSFSLNLTPKQQRRLKLDYLGTTINPTLQQIQPIIDNSDPLNVSIGNAALQQGFTNRFSISGNDYKVLKSRYIGIGANYVTTNNAISSSSIVDALGRRTSQFVNVQGNYNLSANINYGMELFKGVNGGFGINKSISRYVNFVNKIENINDNKATSYSLNLNYWGETWLNFYLQVSASNNNTKSTIRPGAETNYWLYSSYSNFEFKFIKAKTYININTEANLYQKSKVFPNQRDVYIVSPSIRKVFTKSDAWELKLYAFDVFNQNTSISRNISSNFVSESTNNGVQRYFLLGVIYNFSKNGKPESMGF